MPRVTAFETMHPAVPALCLGGAALLGMLVFQPVYLLLSLAGSLLFTVVTVGPADFVRKLLCDMVGRALVVLTVYDDCFHFIFFSFTLIILNMPGPSHSQGRSSKPCF